MRYQRNDRLTALKARFEDRNATLIGSGIDEAPQVYRRLPEALTAQAGAIDVVHRLHPFGVIMAGANEFDPFKD